MIPKFDKIEAWLTDHGTELVVLAPDEGDPSPEYPSEASLIEKMGPARRREFLLGRRAARLALAGLGGAPSPLEQGSRGEPIWPAGFIGSISHTRGLVAAACHQTSSSRRLLGLGIDLEPRLRRLSNPAWEHILAPGEDPAPEGFFRLVVFSAKESLYKALYPLTGEYFGFLDASCVKLNFAEAVSREIGATAVGELSGRLSLKLERCLGEFPAGVSFEARYEAVSDWLLTAVLVVGAWPREA